MLFPNYGMNCISEKIDSRDFANREVGLIISSAALGGKKNGIRQVRSMLHLRNLNLSYANVKKIENIVDHPLIRPMSTPQQ